MLRFEELYISYAPDVYRFSNWLCGDASEAEDITSETFVRAWINFDTARTETLKAYLFTIARNIYLESLRKDKPQVELDEQIADQHPTMERRLEHHSTLDEIREILYTLSEIDRSAFIMRVQYDLDYAEIARVLQISEGSAKVKVHRVRKHLFKARAQKELI